jgi:hypothetical protein
VIDCRGTKAARRFFSRWHELAHLLTLPPTASTPVHRSTTEATGTERLMDVVAAELGFHETLFRPCLEAELARGGGLTFAGVDRVRAGYAPEASRQATLRACVNRLSAPVMLVEASLGFTKDEETRFELEPIPSRRPKPCLRVTQAMANAAARRCGLRIPLRMRVPAGSILSRAYFDANGEGPLGETTAEEDLGGWVHRDGTALPGQRVRVRVEPGRNSVWGLFFAGPSPAALPA